MIKKCTCEVYNKKRATNVEFGQKKRFFLNYGMHYMIPKCAVQIQTETVINNISKQTKQHLAQINFNLKIKRKWNQ